MADQVTLGTNPLSSTQSKIVAVVGTGLALATVVAKNYFNFDLGSDVTAAIMGFTTAALAAFMPHGTAS